MVELLELSVTLLLQVISNTTGSFLFLKVLNQENTESFSSWAVQISYLFHLNFSLMGFLGFLLLHSGTLTQINSFIIILNKNISSHHVSTKAKSPKKLEDAPLKSSELHHCKWNQDQASLFGFIAAILFIISWLIICAINGHKLLLGQPWNEGACVPGLCCVSEPGWCYTNPPVLWGSAAHLNVEWGFSAFPAPVLITRSESWLRLSWVLLFHKVGQSLFCVERQTQADRFCSGGVWVPCIPRTPQSPRRLSPAQCYHCSRSAQPSIAVFCSWCFLFEISKFRTTY